MTAVHAAETGWLARWRDAPVGRRLGAGIGALSACLLGLAAYFWLQTRAIDDGVRGLLERQDPKSDAIHQMKLGLSGVNASALAYLEDGLGRRRRLIAFHEEAFRGALDAYLEDAGSEQERRMGLALRRLFSAWSDRTAAALRARDALQERRRRFLGDLDSLDPLFDRSIKEQAARRHWTASGRLQSLARMEIAAKELRKVPLGASPQEAQPEPRLRAGLRELDRGLRAYEALPLADEERLWAEDVRRRLAGARADGRRLEAAADAAASARADFERLRLIEESLLGEAQRPLDEERASARREIQRWLRRAELSAVASALLAVSFGLGVALSFNRMLDDLRRSRRELERSNRELQEFAYVSSHDLQEPLRKLTAFAQLLQKRNKGRLDADADHYLAAIVGGAARMRALIRALLSYAQVGRPETVRRVTDMNGAVREALADLELAVHESQALVASEDLPAVDADPEQMVMVFRNLIGNALKFHGAQAPRVRVSARTEGGDVVFSVSDNGIGVDARYADRIFVIFQRLHSQDRFPGTGIGLSICRKIVERHGGRIWLESRPGDGATFSFALPARRTEAVHA